MRYQRFYFLALFTCSLLLITNIRPGNAQSPPTTEGTKVFLPLLSVPTQTFPDNFEAPAVPAQLLITFDAGATSQQRQQLFEKYNAQVIDEIADINLFLGRFPDIQDNQQAEAIQRLHYPCTFNHRYAARRRAMTAKAS